MRYIESEKVELKERLTDTLCKEIETFLNTEGGIIYIGIKDNGDVIGVENVDVVLRKIFDIISDQIEPNAIDCVYPEIVYDASKIIIIINVKKGYETLYCIKKYGFSSNGCHLRVGTTCKSMSLEMIKKRIEERALDFDLMVKIPSYYDDLTFSKLRLLLLEQGYHTEDNSYERNLKLRTFDSKFNYLAELLADSNSIPLIFAKFKGLTKASISERSDYGNQCFVLAYEKMKERLKLENICMTITEPRPRRDIFLYDMNAVNEALINAIIHNDYRITDPQVAFFDDRLEIVSHGGLPSGLTKDEFFSGISRPRNRSLMDIFKRLGIVEHTGHGVPTILSVYGREAFEISETLIKVVIPFNKEVLVNHGSMSSSLSTPMNSIEILSTDEKRIMDAITINPSLSAKVLSETLSIPFRSVQRYLAALREKGNIERIGANKNGYWRVIKQ